MIEAAYVLDGDGLQISNTHLGQGLPPSRNRLFTPATRGTDHANKEYFFSLIDTGLPEHITDTYISLATGQRCRTVATRLEHASGASFVLCIDQRLEP